MISLSKARDERRSPAHWTLIMQDMNCRFWNIRAEMLYAMLEKYMLDNSFFERRSSIFMKAKSLWSHLRLPRTQVRLNDPFHRLRRLQYPASKFRSTRTRETIWRDRYLPAVYPEHRRHRIGRKLWWRVKTWRANKGLPKSPSTARKRIIRRPANYTKNWATRLKSERVIAVICITKTL